MFDSLIIARDIHYASSMILAGIILFDLLVASPVLRPYSGLSGAGYAFRTTTGRILWTSLALSIASALAWLCLLSMRISGKSFNDVVGDGVVWTVLSQTQFGIAWGTRLLLAALLTACLFWQRNSKEGWTGGTLGIPACLLAIAYLASLAFAGHGTEGLGYGRIVHLTADALHLMAAGLWLGALPPLALLLALLRHRREDGWAAAAAEAGNRFSTLGILAVGILLVSGAINASFLLAGMHSLVDTLYGQLLLFKVALFAAMLCLAGINRQHLVPQLQNDAAPDGNQRTAQRLVRNSLAETALGFAIILIVGLLGVMAPASEAALHVH